MLMNFRQQAEMKICVQVFKAKWNGIQIVAVKQLQESCDAKAKLAFLREVRCDDADPLDPRIHPCGIAICN